MFISEKRHKEIVEKLKQDLTEAKQLKEVLEIIAKKTGIPSPEGITVGKLSFLASSGDWSTEMCLPNDIPRYVDDFFGGRVIKQEATKVVILDKDGTVTYAFTKQSPDSGFNYKLVR